MQQEQRGQLDPQDQLALLVLLVLLGQQVLPASPSEQLSSTQEQTDDSRGRFHRRSQRRP